MASNPQWVQAKHNYVPEQAHSNDELKLTEGDVVRVVDSSDPDGWWLGELCGKQGLFPSNYCEACAAPGAGQNAPKINSNTRSSATKDEPRPSAVPSAVGPNNIAVTVNPSKAGGAAKPASQEGVELKTRAKKNSSTRFGVWASNLACYCGVFYSLAGMALLLWGAQDKVSPFLGQEPGEIRAWGTKDAFVGAWALFTGMMTFAGEWKFGYVRTGKKCSFRAMAYIGVCAPGFMTTATLIPAAFFLVPIVVNFVSGYLAEVYVPPVPRKRRPGEKDERTLGLKLFELYAGNNPEGQLGRSFCLTLWIAGTLWVGIDNLLRTIETNNARPEGAQFTGWVPLAKFFGGVMNLNFSIIALPVSRSLIRWCYNNSSGDRSCFSLTMRYFLKLVPLDQAHDFHKLCAWTGFVSAACHTVAHLINFGAKSVLVWEVYGVSVWITGTLLLFVMLLLFSATHLNIKRGHFEIFWATHMLFPVFFATCILHGRDWLGPNYFKWFLFPGSVFFLERVYRELSARKEVAVVAVTHMSNGVLALTLAKSGALENYKEGQYAYLMCPSISRFQWHPFTISSAPSDKFATFHIRIQGPGSWTRKLQHYTSIMCRKDKPHTEFNRVDATGKSVPGKILGPDGKQMFRVYGPHSAPTQHLTEYNEVMICASGIGVTPLAGAMKSIVHHRWKYFSGKTYPDTAHFFWITSHAELKSFRWFVRTVKEVEDDVYDQMSKRGADAEATTKKFAFHIYVTSYRQGQLGDEDKLDIDPSDPDSDIRFWGVPAKESQGVVANKCPFTEEDLYLALLNPGRNGTKSITLGHVTVHNGRPNWKPHFDEIQQSSTESDIGVTFCGNPGIGGVLRKMCNSYSRANKEKTFHLHQEVF